LFAAGAKRCILPFADLGEICSPDEITRIRSRRPDPRGIELMTVHIMGSARMALDPRRGATDPFGPLFHVPGLYVADASLFPSPVGVNPQETIMALVTRNVRRWLEEDLETGWPPSARNRSTDPLESAVAKQWGKHPKEKRRPGLRPSSPLGRIRRA